MTGLRLRGDRTDGPPVARAVVEIETNGDHAPPLPSRTTFYRLVVTVAAGKGTFGSARPPAQGAHVPFGTLYLGDPVPAEGQHHERMLVSE